MSLFKSYLFDDDTPNLARVINSVNAGIWQFDLKTKEVKWSAGLFASLGYEQGEVECSYSNFMDNILYYQDKSLFLATVSNRRRSSSEIAYIRLLTKNGYEWFQSTIDRQANAKITGTLININQFKFSELQLTTKNTLIAETNKLLKMGAWEIDIAPPKLFLNVEALDIFGLQQQPATVEQLIGCFEQEHRQLLAAAMEDCIKIGKPFDLDLRLKTEKGNVIWTKIKAVAKIDDYGKCERIKGVIQDIDDTKHSEYKLKSTLNLISQKNERLQNFAYITSHNLRSHAGNLQLMLNLYAESESQIEQQKILSHIRSISTSLSATIEHLNEIVKVDLLTTQEKIRIEFDLLFKNILNSLQSNIQVAGAIVNYDFSMCRYVYYLPAYLESIFHNLLTNALKYRSRDRQLIITCKSIIEDEHVYLIFEDNGIGIDMKKNGEKIFGMYQTFHPNPDSQGIGLYITRNQIEALGGTISVESNLDRGTKFIIKLL